MYLFKNSNLGPPSLPPCWRVAERRLLSLYGRRSWDRTSGSVWGSSALVPGLRSRSPSSPCVSYTAEFLIICTGYNKRSSMLHCLQSGCVSSLPLLLTGGRSVGQLTGCCASSWPGSFRSHMLLLHWVNDCSTLFKLVLEPRRSRAKERNARLFFTWIVFLAPTLVLKMISSREKNIFKDNCFLVGQVLVVFFQMNPDNDLIYTMIQTLTVFLETTLKPVPFFKY